MPTALRARTLAARSRGSKTWEREPFFCSLCAIFIQKRPKCKKGKHKQGIGLICSHFAGSTLPETMGRLASSTIVIFRFTTSPRLKAPRMPEGHTIHRIAADHKKWFAMQKQIVLSPQGRFAKEADMLSGSVLRDVSAHGKHLFYHWNRNRIWHVHLGLYGKFRLHDNPAPDPRGAVRVRMIGKKKSFDLNGPNCCELLDSGGYQKLRSRLGEDPLRPDADPDVVWQKFEKSHSAIGSLLLNQSVICGIGNIYRAEILFLLGMDPGSPACHMDRETFDRFWNLTCKLLTIGREANQIITRNLNQKPVRRARTAERLNIYKATNCPDCSQTVRTRSLAGRTLYYCPGCQHPF